MFDLYRTGTGVQGTPGVIFFDGDFISVSLELQWLDNQRDISCVKAGLYRITVHESPKFGHCAKLHAVPGRDDILVHWGNWAGVLSLEYLSNTLGCIMPGTIFTELVGQSAIKDSKKAFAVFMEVLEAVGGESTINIHDLFEVAA